jgi:hypothetical protein
MGSVRLDWTIDSFYSSGGTTSFIDRLSSVLGVHPSTIFIVTVKTGSVIVGFTITNPTSDSSYLSNVKATIE